jgi:hypothetical protein
MNLLLFQKKRLSKGIRLVLDFMGGNLDSRISFSRGSNATVVGSNGLIRYAPHNLLTYSEQFDNAAWAKGVGVTVTANAIVSPDGNITADLITTSAASTSCFQTITRTINAGDSYTSSIWLKASGSDIGKNVWVGIRRSGAGTLEQAYTKVTLTSNWTRVTTTLTFANAQTGVIFDIRNDGSGTPATAWYSWGAQLNEGALQPYYSTTVMNLLGYSQNFENAAWSKSNSSVLYNLESYSQQFSNAFWDKAGGLTTVTDNFTTAPDGTTTATKWTEAAGTGSHHIHDLVGSYTPVIGLPYTMSMYLKQTETNPDRYVQMTFWLAGFSATAYANFDMQTGTVAFQGASITNATIEVANNGWYRLSITSLATATGASGWQAAFVSSGTAPRAESYTVTAGNEESYYLWGAQVVASPLAENYTVTTSASAPIQAIGPFGFGGGQKLVENTAAVAHTITQGSLTIGLPITYSFYAKEGGRSKINLAGGGYNSQGFVTVFNLSSGVLDTNVGNKASITPVGNGWYRCAVSFTPSTTSSLSIALLDNMGISAYTGDGTSGIYIFGAQLSDSASLDPYSYNPVAAPTSTAYYGPRFDYDPVTLAPKGLLIEEQRTNLTPYSRYESGQWTFSAASVGNQTKTGVDGTSLTAFLANTTTSAHRVNRTLSGSYTANSIYTFSFYVAKPAISDILGMAIRIRSTLGGQAIGVVASNAGENSTYTFSSSAPFGTNPPAAITASNFLATNVGNNWVRISVTTAIASIDTTLTQWDIGFSTAIGSDTGLGTANSQIFIDSVQLEAGAFPTSYIPTTSATVTRAADNASMVGSNFSSWYNQSAGTFVTSFDMYYATNTIGAFPRIISVSNGSSANLIDIQSAQYNNENMTIVDTSVQQCSISATQFAANTTGKFAGSFATNNFQISANGVLGIADTVGTVPIVNQMQIGNRWDLIRPMSGHIQSIKYYPKRLPNTDLQRLTR